MGHLSGSSCFPSPISNKYSEQLSFEFHWAAVEELLRMASEVRIFPLLSLGAISDLEIELSKPGGDERSLLESLSIQIRAKGTRWTRRKRGMI